MLLSNKGKKAVFQRAILLFVTMVLSVFSFAQKKDRNLVPNSGFETHKNKSPIIKNAIPWMGEGTVDYFLKTDKKDTSIYKGPHTGKCYAGLRFQAKYKEYM